MAVGTVTKYNNTEANLFKDASRQWDNPTVGNIMFCLCGNSYVFDAADATTGDLSGLITSGDGAPINATGLLIDETLDPGKTYYQSDDANFGASVTITAKWMIAVQPVVAGTFDAATSKLIFAIDLNTASPTATISSAGSDFVILQPDTPFDGWFRTV